MTQSVRYQKGQLYPEHNAWFVRYRERRRQRDGSIKNERRSKRLRSMQDYPTKSEIEPVRIAFMQKVNSGQVIADEGMTLLEFVQAVYCRGRRRNCEPARTRDTGRSGRITCRAASVRFVCASSEP